MLLSPLFIYHRLLYNVPNQASRASKGKKSRVKRKTQGNSARKRERGWTEIKHEFPFGDHRHEHAGGE